MLQVALRVRPISEDEIIQGATPVAHKVDKKVSAQLFTYLSKLTYFAPDV